MLPVTAKPRVLLKVRERKLANSDPNWAFAAYEAVRARLPSPTFGGRPQRAARLAEVAKPFDLVLLDAYGVLNVGETPIEGAAEAIAALRRAGKSVMVVSNSAGYPKARMMQRFADLGFDFAPNEVVTSREALLAHLQDEPHRRWGLMLDPGQGMAELDHLDAIFLDDAPSGYDSAQGFLLIGSGGWSDARQRRLEDALRHTARPVLVGNPDIVAPRETGLSREPGFFAHRLADRTGAEPLFFGKPFASVYHLALARLPVSPDPARVLMVGDTLHTDILGGRNMGFATALVTDFGSLAGSDVDRSIAHSGIVPNFVLNRI